MIKKQQAIDIISSILHYPQWEATYLFELIEAVIGNTEDEPN